MPFLSYLATHWLGVVDASCNKMEELYDIMCMPLGMFLASVMVYVAYCSQGRNYSSDALIDGVTSNSQDVNTPSAPATCRWDLLDDDLQRYICTLALCLRKEEAREHYENLVRMDFALRHADFDEPPDWHIRIHDLEELVKDIQTTQENLGLIEYGEKDDLEEILQACLSGNFGKSGLVIDFDFDWSDFEDEYQQM